MRAAPAVALSLLAAAWFSPTTQPCAADAVGNERVTVIEPTGRRTLEGAIVVEAADGGLLLELPTQRYVVVEPATIAARERLAAAAVVESPRELGQRIAAELPPGFEIHLTRHYVVCFNTSRDYAKWAATLFERLHEAFGNYWRQAGLDLSAHEQPLPVVLFAARGDYQEIATRDLGRAADQIAGYFNMMTNRITSYDITGTLGLPRSPRGMGDRIGSDILARPEAAGLVSTLVHEATHQMVYNSGLARRLAPVPVWVNEGIAAVFETPDLRNPAGWRGIGLVNKPRLDRFRRSFEAGGLEPLIVGDERFRDPGTAIDAYAAAWALTWFLLETRRDQFVAYLRLQAAKQPLGADSPERRLEDFQTAFGEPPAAIEARLLRHMSRLELRRP